MKKNVTPLPVNFYRTVRRRLGARFVGCEVSSRYLVFPEQSTRIDAKKDFMCVDVMTMNSEDQPHKLCELVLNRDDLLAALAACPTKE